MTIQATRYHDISCGHRVVGHEGKCRNLHGHNYRITFTVQAKNLDSIGRVMDFSVIKAKLCAWLEENWDHKMILWDQDPLAAALTSIDKTVVLVPFNPTAENIGLHLINVIGPALLQDTDVYLMTVNVEETRKCSATVEC